MTKLADLLRGRLAGDPRALVAALEISHDRILLTFGGIGKLPRIVLGIEGNAVKVLTPEVEPDEPAEDPAGDDDGASGGQTAATAKDAAREGGDTGNQPEGSGGASGAPAEPKLIDPDAHKLDELKAMAATAGVEVSAKATKKQIADALNAAAAAK